MKTRTKLLTAVLSTVTALSCALTAAAAGANPTLILQGNETTPAAAEDTSVTLSLKATEFGDVAGADLKLTLKGDISLDSANVTITNNATGQSWNLEKESNYTVSGNTLKIVDVFNMTGAPTATDLDLRVVLKFNGDVNIGRYAFDCNATLVNESEQTITPAGVTMGKLVIGKKTETITGNGTATDYDVNDCFLPYGSVSEGDTYLVKDQEGKFTFNGDKEVTRFIVPDTNEAVTTFGASKGTVNDSKNAIQFGSYANNVKSGDSFGTLLIAPTDTGNFDDVIKYYKNNTDYKTVEAILNRFAQLLASAENNKLYTIKYNKGAQKIKVAKIPQNNYMWRNGDKDYTKLQYAVRLVGLDTSDAQSVEYTAIGYSVNAGIYNFSTEIKSASYSSLE